MDRPVPSVKPPPWHPLTDEELYNGPKEENQIDIAKLTAFLKDGGHLSPAHVSELLSLAADIFRSEENIVYLYPPMKVVGDIHGQFYDLLPILERDFNQDDRLLFLGDYVDRGSFGVECVLLLCAYKIVHPRAIYLIRGNHECRTLTKKFNFYAEVLQKYDESIFEQFMSLFDTLPLASVIESDIGTMLAVHGGISETISTTEDILEIDRFQEIPHSGRFCDLMWSDPLGEDTAEGCTDEDMVEWWDVDYVPNPTRGVGSVYGYKAVKRFLDDNMMVCIIRAHETAKTGYTENWMCRKGMDEDRVLPYVVTLFSAPNYCGWYENQGAVMTITDQEVSYYQYRESEQPYVLPKNLNGISYSLPFVTEKLVDFIGNFFSVLLDADEAVEEETSSPEIRETMEKKSKILRSKVMMLGKMRKQLKVMEKHNDAAVALKGLYGGELPQKVQNLSSNSLTKLANNHDYSVAKELDLQNELSPRAGRSRARSQDSKFWKEREALLHPPRAGDDADADDQEQAERPEEV